MNSHLKPLGKYLLIDLLGSIAWFPVWWYTVGLKRQAVKAVRALEYRYQAYGFRIWIRNFFVPMYGQYDFGGRAISILMRFVVLIGRGIALVVEGLVLSLGVAVWAAAPTLFLVFALTNLSKGLFMEQVKFLLG
ncbi:MAG: hypothetical protein RDU25_03880 [Patescibacteria group bacterium]|nr:hypothetical protein [Patescibacteria group bacterium]